MRNAVRLIFGLMLAVGIVSGCGEDEVVPEETELEQPVTPEDLPSSDLDEVVDIKGDGASFNRHMLVEQSVFEDPLYVTLKQVQEFFEYTPYGKRCFLADYSVNGMTAAEIIMDACQRYAINPLIILVKLQVEMGLVSRSVPPNQFKLDHALGCACADNTPCSSGHSGFEQQVECATELFRRYLNQHAEDGKTWTGWAMGVSRAAEDGVDVTPANEATAALYTYTPWVLQGQGGNWLFWNVYKKYGRHFTKLNPNHHWIGGSCESGLECPYQDGLCVEEAGGGMCSAGCSGFCPDSTAPFSSITFCVDLGTYLNGIAEGYCVSRCSDDLYPDTFGCREGYSCVPATRYLHPEVSKNVCWPDSLLPESDGF